MSSEAHVRHPSLGGLASGEGALKVLGLEGQWGLSAGAPQNWVKRDSTLGDCTQGFNVHRDPGQSHDSIGAWADLRVRGRSRKGLLRRQGGWLLLTVGAGTLGVEIPENIHWHELSRKWPFWLPFQHQDLPHPTACRFQS